MWGKKLVTTGGKLQTIPETICNASLQSPTAQLSHKSASQSPVSLDSKYHVTSTPTKSKAIAVVGHVTASPESDFANRSGNLSAGYISMNSSQSSQSTPQKVTPAAPKPLASVRNHLELFVKTGRDGKNAGACPMCQQIFMMLLLKAQAGSLTFAVTAVNISKPPADFKDLSNRVPTLIHGQEVLKDTDEIVEFIEKKFPVPSLAPEYNGYLANEICSELMSKLAFYLKDVSGSPAQLTAELLRINDFLASQNSRFLCGDRMSLIDCVVLPKLQHIRVTVKAFKRFELPHNLVYLWRYLMFAYNNEIFKKTCPCDQEIVYHWFHKSTAFTDSSGQRSGGITIQELMTSGSPDRFSLDVPKDIKIPPLL